MYTNQNYVSNAIALRYSFINGKTHALLTVYNRQKIKWNEGFDGELTGHDE